MTFSEHYKDFKWIKVKRFTHYEDLSPEANYRSLIHHHMMETTFLIEEVRKLAKVVDYLSDQGWGTPGDYERIMKNVEEDENEEMGD